MGKLWWPPGYWSPFRCQVEMRRMYSLAYSRRKKMLKNRPFLPCISAWVKISCCIDPRYRSKS